MANELASLRSDNARLLVALRNLYCDHAALLIRYRKTTGEAYVTAGRVLRELEPKGEVNDADN